MLISLAGRGVPLDVPSIVPKIPFLNVKLGVVRFAEPRKYVLISGNRFVFVAASCQRDLLMSSFAMLTGRLLIRAIWIASASVSSGAAFESCAAATTAANPRQHARTTSAP